jgi:hypothetical protein
MVKRAKLTLDHQAVAPEGVADADEDTAAGKETKPPEAEIAQEKQTTNLWKVILIAGLTLVSLVIFQRKIF